MKVGRHGGDVYTASFETGREREGLLDFSANINPLGVPLTVQKAITENIKWLGDYPDPLCRRLKEKLALHEGVPEAQLICGNGAADLIFRLAYVLKPKKALVLAPTFSEYEEALSLVDCEIDYYDLDEEKAYSVQEDFLDYIREALDVLFICNPNNPTGQVTSKAFMIKVLEKCNEKGVWVIVDECFNDFLDQPEAYTLKEVLEDYPKLFILKAFTKMYAMAGVRLGYGMSSQEDLMDKLYRAAQPWSVSSIAQVAGIAALEDTAYVEQTKSLIKEERAYLKSGLRDLGFTVYASYANYIFFKTSKIEDLVGKLRDKGILIRSCSNYRQLGDNYYRVAVRTRQENKRLLEAMKEI